MSLLQNQEMNLVDSLGENIIRPLKNDNLKGIEN